MYFGLLIISCFKIIGDFISFHFVINYVIKLNKLRVLSSGDFILTKIWAGAIKDADMERYLEIRITAVSYTHLDVYKRQWIMRRSVTEAYLILSDILNICKNMKLIMAK